ncbi:hypothetical protein QCD60_10780 [Pokkaliibacter sp. MBI-7]|uniref:hypothetical protein n=1 Tax=Pokkaliibacter sp. MBI-7 TaxID=3040600 RepID=UPI00244D7743|nr:hypothetical protein [Pokkaliibacter sp. MBI-7]MDH2433053.1 hypothetical protein [Pokkaliibacter sp. MBI-7]
MANLPPLPDWCFRCKGLQFGGDATTYFVTTPLSAPFHITGQVSSRDLEFALMNMNSAACFWAMPEGRSGYVSRNAGHYILDFARWNLSSAHTYANALEALHDLRVYQINLPYPKVGRGYAAISRNALHAASKNVTYVGPDGTGRVMIPSGTALAPSTFAAASPSFTPDQLDQQQDGFYKAGIRQMVDANLPDSLADYINSMDVLQYDDPMEALGAERYQTLLQEMQQHALSTTEGMAAGAMASLLGIRRGSSGIADDLARKYGKETAEALLKDIDNAMTNSRSLSEALGKLGMEQGRRLLGLKPDPRYVDRYHGPDGMSRDANGNLVEEEAKGTAGKSTAVASNNEGDKQGSAEKNARRGRQVSRKSPKINQPSNRQGGPYSSDEIDLWREIANLDGKKRHISYHTDTETGQTTVYERDHRGNITDTLEDFVIQGFNEAKDIIGGLFK